VANIDIRGLLGGKRINRCAAEARWRFPYYFLLSNAYARIELDYEAIALHFVSFRGGAPTAEDIENDFKAYIASHLIFVYQVGSKVWGQWDCRREQTVRHKDAPSKRSPHPPEAEYQEWLKEQHPADWGIFHWSSGPIVLNKEESSTSQKLQITPKPSEDLKIVPRGVGVGVGVGVGGGIGKYNPLPPLEKPVPLEQNPEDQNPEQAREAIDLDVYSAAKGLGELIGMSAKGGGLHMLTSAIEQAERRWKDKRRVEVITAIVALWKEYCAQGHHAPIALHNWLKTLGRFIDSDDWKLKKPVEFKPDIDWQGGHVGQDGIYVNKTGRRIPGFVCPPQPKGVEA
jgi:hypothetical protein